MSIRVLCQLDQTSVPDAQCFTAALFECLEFGSVPEEGFSGREGSAGSDRLGLAGESAVDHDAVLD